MTFLAFGNHTVRNLINSPYFTFKKILLREEEYKNDKNFRFISLPTIRRKPMRLAGSRRIRGPWRLSRMGAGLRIDLLATILRARPPGGL